MKKDKIVFACKECGTEHMKWQGQCSGCGAWNTLVEFKMAKPSTNSTNNMMNSWTNSKKEIVKFSEVTSFKEQERIDTGLKELNRALGGGIMPSSSIIISGEPGAGKSTILMQIAAYISKLNKKVVYVSAEEVLSALKNRAERLNVNIDNVSGISDNNLENILELLEKEKPDLVIVDSIQAIYSSQIPSNIGSVNQIKSCALLLNKQSKELNYAVVFVGHITKDGDIAGPKVFEHIVDVTLKFEVEGNSNFRSITAEKNRFGANETGFFEMTETGLLSVDNPSNLFLNKNEENSEGSAIYVMKKGTRSLLVEIQVLVEMKNYNSPKRIVYGLDVNKLHMLLALNNKYFSIALNESDVYAMVLNGISAKQPEADLPLFIALFSSYLKRSVDKNLVSFGEISLNGEIKSVSSVENRIKDALLLGFNKIILPYSNKSKNLDKLCEQNSDLKLFYIKHIKDLANILTNAEEDINNSY